MTALICGLVAMSAVSQPAPMSGIGSDDQKSFEIILDNSVVMKGENITGVGKASGPGAESAAVTVQSDQNPRQTASGEGTAVINFTTSAADTDENGIGEVVITGSGSDGYGMDQKIVSITPLIVTWLKSEDVGLAHIGEPEMIKRIATINPDTPANRARITLEKNTAEGVTATMVIDGGVLKAKFQAIAKGGTATGVYWAIDGHRASETIDATVYHIEYDKAEPAEGDKPIKYGDDDAPAPEGDVVNGGIVKALYTTNLTTAIESPEANVSNTLVLKPEPTLQKNGEVVMLAFETLGDSDVFESKSQKTATANIQPKFTAEVGGETLEWQPAKQPIKVERAPPEMDLATTYNSQHPRWGQQSETPFPNNKAMDIDNETPSIAVASAVREYPDLGNPSTSPSIGVTPVGLDETGRFTVLLTVPEQVYFKSITVTTSGTAGWELGLQITVSAGGSTNIQVPANLIDEAASYIQEAFPGEDDTGLAGAITSALTGVAGANTTTFAISLTATDPAGKQEDHSGENALNVTSTQGTMTKQEAFGEGGNGDGDEGGDD